MFDYKKKVQELLSKGYKVISESKDRIKLKKNKKFNWMALIVSTVTVSCLVYLGYYFFKKSKFVVVKKE